jgi:hypothetical protein
MQPLRLSIIILSVIQGIFIKVKFSYLLIKTHF